MSRRLARETALQVLFQFDLIKHGEDTATAVKHWAEEFAVPETSIPFAQELVHGTIEHREEIDHYIAALSEGWPLERMAGVDRNILRLAAYEILYRPDIPAPVSLNEAIELAKRFGGADSAKFVNGILDRLLALNNHAGVHKKAKSETINSPNTRDQVGEDSRGMDEENRPV